VVQGVHLASPSRRPITLDRHRAFSRPDPIRNPVPIKFDGVTNAHMRKPALPRPVTNCFWMESQDFAHILDIEQTGLSFEFFGKGVRHHAAKIAAKNAAKTAPPQARVAKKASS
jgi:hypothetical protein